MVHNQNLIDELIVKYARQEKLTEEEALLLEQWCSLSPGHRVLPELFRDQVKNGRDLRVLSPVPLDSIREKVMQGIKKGKVKPIRTPGKFWHWPRWGTVPIVIATIMLVLWGINGLIKYYHNFEPTDKTVMVKTPPPVRKPLPPPDENHVTLIKSDGSRLVLDSLPGKSDSLVLAETGSYSENWLVVGPHRKSYNLRLPDGSRIQLKPGSRWHFPDFEAKELVARLEGEGFFDIAKNKSRPFTVLGPGGVGTSVLGTIFAFYADPQKEVKVSLISGAVRVFHQQESILLQPDQEAVLRGGGLVKEKMTKASELLNWSGDTLLFRFQNTDLTKVVEEIAQWYDLKIDNPARVKGLAITAVFPRNMSPEAIVEQIRTAESGTAWLEIRADNIVISRYRSK